MWRTVDFEPDAGGVLDDLIVVDLSRLVAGNMASLQLADFGARVIKVEPLPRGDPLRAWTQAGAQTFWKVYARNKESLALDFRAEGALDVLRRLIGKADVLIEGFRPGTLEGMGLGPDVLHGFNPGLIVLRIAGFGQEGPYSHRPGFGTLVEGMSGFASRNGVEDGDPLLPPLALADMISALYGSNATMMALRARDKGGPGQLIDLALLDSMVSVLGPEALDYRLTGEIKPRMGNASNMTSPRNVYRTKDGHFIGISGSIQSAAERLFRAIGRADMIDDPRFRDNTARVAHRDEVDAIVGGWIGERDRREAMAVFEAEGITAAPIYDTADIGNDPHFIARGIYVAAPDADLGTAEMHAPVPRLSRTPGRLRRPAPDLGGQTREILAFAGFSDEETDTLLAEGIALTHAMWRAREDSNS